MLLTRYGHQRKLNSPTVRRRQFLLGCSVPTIDAHRPDVHERDDVFIVLVSRGINGGRKVIVQSRRLATFPSLARRDLHLARCGHVLWCSSHTARSHHTPICTHHTPHSTLSKHHVDNHVENTAGHGAARGATARRALGERAACRGLSRPTVPEGARCRRHLQNVDPRPLR